MSKQRQQTQELINSPYIIPKCAVFGIIYCFINMMNNKVYVGQHIGQIIWTRWDKDLRGGNPHFDRAVKKYGIKAFRGEILAYCYSQQELDNLEKLWILTLRSYDPEIGYNKTFGGEGGSKTQETRDKMKAAWELRVVSDEMIERCIRNYTAMIGVPNHRRGKKHTEASILKMIESLIPQKEIRKQRMLSCWADSEFRENRIISQKHEPHTEETKKLLSTINIERHASKTPEERKQGTAKARIAREVSLFEQRRKLNPHAISFIPIRGT